MPALKNPDPVLSKPSEGVEVPHIPFNMDRPNMSEYDCVKALTLLEEGYSQREVARRLGVHHTTIGRTLQRFRETGSHRRRRGQGRPRSTSDVDDRFIRLQALRNRDLAGRELSDLIQRFRGVQISSRTVRRRLREGGLNSRRPAEGPRLTAAHRKKRLEFARSHLDWTLEHWKRVLFTDETRVGLKSPDGRARVWRRPGERFAKCCVQPRVAFSGGSVMFWGGISYDARTELVPVRGGALTSQRYISDILEEHVMPFAPYIGEEFLLMHDNARPHRGRIVDAYLDEVGISRIDWPPRSPDLNPIEHVWDTLKRCVRRRRPAPDTLQELERAVLEEWENIPQETIQELFHSIPRRLMAIIRARGGNTQY